MFRTPRARRVAALEISGAATAPRLSALAALLLFVILFASSVAGSFGDAPRLWFAPDAGSPDMVRLFQAPEEWSFARDHLSVFKFYEGQLLEPVPSGPYLPNDYVALRGVDAFRKLMQWRKQIAIEVAAVKPFSCGPSGMRQPIRDTVQAVANVAAAGGRVSLLAMDEPIFAGVTTAGCGGPDVAPTLTRLEQYMRVLHAVLRDIAIGDIEPYPVLSETQIEDAVVAMRERGIAPAFLHLDVDLNALQHNGHYAGYDVAADMKRLKIACEQQGIRFGFLIWGKNTDSDAVYYADAMQRVQLLKEAFGAWQNMPDDLVFQSFAMSGNGQAAVPLNLPETGPNTHTNLIDRGLLLLQGVATTGTARPGR